MTSYYFSFHSIKWALVSDQAFNLETLIEDYLLYQREPHQQVDFEIILTSNSKKRPQFMLSGKSYAFSLGWKKRYFQFDSELYGYETVNQKRTLWIWGKNKRRLREVVNSYVHSVLGEEMDKRGWHRLHAVGVLHNGALVIPLNSKAGKSSFSYWVSESQNLKLLSDETIFTDGKSSLGFATRIALRAKPNSNHEIYQRYGHPDKYLIPFKPAQYEMNEVPFHIWLPINKWSKLSFFVTCVLGLGSTQMIEFMVRPDNIMSLIKIALSRAKVAYTLLGLVVLEAPWSSSPEKNLLEIQKIQK